MPALCRTAELARVAIRPGSNFRRPQPKGGWMRSWMDQGFINLSSTTISLLLVRVSAGFPSMHYCPNLNNSITRKQTAKQA
jgi:hypothetical protein